jgi:hypothetical protein
MARKGAFIEFTFGAYTATTLIPMNHYYVEKEYASIDEGLTGGLADDIPSVARSIREIGAKHCIMSTDFGYYGLSTPVEGLRQFIACMLDLGIRPEDIQLMVKTNPEKLLGIE